MASKSGLSVGGLEWRLVLAGSCLFAAGVIARGILSRPTNTGVAVPSPRSTLLPKLSEEEKAQLPYPPDVLPGARDVDTPYGSIRAYEFGPEEGRKVLLVHGISTPAIALGAVAQALVDKGGCRVMLFDLFGRGYSDNPSDVPHDIRLFSTQILLVLTSSPLAWTGKGSGKFTLIGYSLGGGISATFTSYFPDLVDSLILFAPAGLVRPQHISRANRVLYSEGLIPEVVLHRLIKQRLRRPLAAPPQKSGAAAEDDKKMDATDAVQAEAVPVNIESNSQAPLSKLRPHVTVAATVVHQLEHHPAFVAAFMSSIRYGPIRFQHDRWRMIGDRLRRQNEEKGTHKKVLVVMGATDPIIIRHELEEDARAVLGPDVVEFAALDAGHEVPVTKSDQVVDCIMDFWSRTD